MTINTLNAMSACASSDVDVTGAGATRKSMNPSDVNNAIRGLMTISKRGTALMASRHHENRQLEND